MSTRAIIRFFDSAAATEPFAALYEQCNGYPEGLGAKLQKMQLADGLNPREGRGHNEMACFAAAVVAKLKRGVYGTYLSDPRHPVAPRGYTYDLRPSEDTRGHVFCRLWGYDGKTVEYDGPLRDAPWTKPSNEPCPTCGTRPHATSTWGNRDD